MAKRTAEQKTKTANKSRRKGKRGERKLIPLLNDWWGEKFRRVPRSGALRWGTDHRVAGDLVTSDPDFPWVVEAKNRESWDLKDLFLGQGPIFSWFQQAADDGKRVNKKPLLFFTKNYHPYYVFVKLDDLDINMEADERTDHFVLHHSIHGVIIVAEAASALKTFMKKAEAIDEPNTTLGPPPKNEGIAGLGSPELETRGKTQRPGASS